MTETALTRNYYVYDTAVIDEEVCQRQGRAHLAVYGGEYGEVWIHKHKRFASCVAREDTGEVDVLGKPIYNQHCYRLLGDGAIAPLTPEQQG